MLTERGLVVFDVETTGLEIGKDRVVSLGAVELGAGGSTITDRFYTLVDPGIPIPAAATAIHGITDAEVQEFGMSPVVAFREFLTFIGDSDLAGYNCDRFDVPFLEADMHRVGLYLDVGSRRVLDVWKLWNALEPPPTRTLADAAERFGIVAGDAHNAHEDARATADVLVVMLEDFSEAPEDVESLERLTFPEGALDRGGQVVAVDGVASLSFGKHKGKALKDVPADYFTWALDKGKFPKDTCALFEAELHRRRFAK